MRGFVSFCFILFFPIVASAEPRVTNVDVESTEPEVRIIIRIDPPSSAPAHRLMHDHHSLRLRFIDLDTEEIERDLDDETIRKLKVIPYRNRVIVRLDPRRGEASSMMERSEVQPHPQGVVLVIQRSDAEVSLYRAHRRAEQRAEETQVASSNTPEPSAEQTPETTPSADEAENAAESSDEDENRAEIAAPASAGASRRHRTTPSPEENSTGSSFPLRATLAVIFILGLAAAAWYYRRRGSRTNSGPSYKIDVVAAKRIGPRQSLILVAVGDQKLLVGTTEKGMNRLASISDQSIENEDDLFIAEDEEIAPMPAKKERKLTPLEQELRKMAPDQDEEEKTETPSWTNLFAAKALSANTNRTSSPPAPSPSPDPVKGLMRLRQMADDSTARPPQLPHLKSKKANGKVNGKANGKAHGDMSIAALESLLMSRQAN